MTSLLEKERNQKYILDNLDKYVLDSRGNFYSKYFEEHDEELFFIGKEAVSNWEEIIKVMTEMILKNKENWEVDLDDGIYITNRKDGRKINARGLGICFGEIYGYKVVGELGYREGAWKNYEEDIKSKEEYEEASRKYEELLRQYSNFEESKNQSPLPTLPQEPENQNNPPPNQEQPINSKNNNNESTNQDNSPSLPPNQENNSLPIPTDIQTHYNSDKDKSTIDNSSNLTNPEQKEQAQELLKIIITAELSAKEKKFNPETLSKLIKEKEQNTSLYQFLNKEGRMDKVINDLESIKKFQKDNNNSVNKNKKDNNITVRIIAGGILLLAIVGIGVTVLARKKKLKVKK